MSFHLVISKPRKATFNQYTITEVERKPDGEPIKAKFIQYAKDNNDAKMLARKYCDFHFIDSIVFANGKEAKA